MSNLESLQQYEKIRSLGEGASGQTFLVRSLKSPENVFALKVFSDFQDQSEKLQSFEQEWRVLETLNHPHLAKVFQHGSENGSLFFTTEFVEGQDFVSVCKNLDWNAIFVLIVQAAWALDYLHAKGFAHRDLKPANILVGKIFEKGSSSHLERLRLKVIDFGLAASISSLKSSNETVGTLPYIAPEILRKENYDSRVDFYSLGVILYEVAVGRLPLEVKGQFSKYLHDLAHQEIDLFALQEWGTPKGVVEIISGLLKIDPEKRISSGCKIIEILNKEENENFSDKASLETPVVEAVSLKQEKYKLTKSEMNLRPRELVEKIRMLSRGGEKVKALSFVEHYFSEVDLWKAETDIADFYASGIHLWIDQGDFSKAQKYLEKFKEHPKVQEDNLEKKLTQINFYYRKGDLKKAEEQLAFIHANNIFTEAQPGQLARFYNLCALISKDNKKWNESIQYFETASFYAKEAKRPDQELALIMNAAATSFDQGEWGQAYQLYQKSLKLAQEMKNDPLLASIYNNLGNLYLLFGRWNESIASLQTSLNLAKEHHLKPLIAYNLNLLTQSEEGKGNWEIAEKLIQESLEFSKELGDSQPVLQAQLEKAYFEWNQKKYSDCLSSLQAIREKAEILQQPFYLLQADWLEVRYAISQDVFDSKKIFELLQKIKKDAQGHRSLRNLWEVCVDEASLFQKLDQADKARESYHQALDVLNQIQEKIPEEFRESFWRDRKKEKIKRALHDLENLKIETHHKDAVQFEFNSHKSLKGEIVMGFSEQKKQNENRLEKNATLSFEKWVEINRRLLTQSQTSLILDEIMDDAIAITDAERGFVIYSESQELDVKSCRNMDGETLKGEEEKFSYTIAQEVMRKGESVMISDAQKDSRFSGAASVLALKIRSVLCVPLRSGLKTVGLVYLDNRFREGVFRDEHLPIIEALADQASLGLEHARLHQENLKKIEELKKSKELIEKLNSKLEKDLDETSAHLLATKESMKRQNEEISLRYTYDKIIGESAKIKNVLKKLDRIVDSSMSVFIHGESGTGKELIAQAIHFNGARKEKPFIAENCTALPETLLESELFGHVQGSFTGADKNKIGLFELANGGTLFLDEVGDMPLSMQAKLLRVLQEGEVRQVGGKDYRKVDVRIITASNKDLKQLVDEGKFRQDLYYRINVVQIDLPPLRERKEDIPLLLNYFLEQETTKLGLPKPKVSKEAMKVLVTYDWPGNIRELLNEVTRFVSLRDLNVDIHSVSSHLVEKVEQGEQQIGQKGLDFLISLVEKKAIMDAMYKARGNKVKAAKILKIGRRTLYAKIDLYKIDSEFGKNVMFATKNTSPKLAS